jgi:hypothetical protein
MEQQELSVSLSYLDNTQALQTLETLINVKIAIGYPEKLILISEDKFCRVDIRGGTDRKSLLVKNRQKKLVIAIVYGNQSNYYRV